MNLWASIWLLARFEVQKAYASAKWLVPCQVMEQIPEVDRQAEKKEEICLLSLKLCYLCREEWLTDE